MLEVEPLVTEMARGKVRCQRDVRDLEKVATSDG